MMEKRNFIDCWSDVAPFAKSGLGIDTAMRPSCVENAEAMA